MTRKSWVQDPETGKLIPKEEWYAKDRGGTYIQGDIEPFVSPITRQVISTRSALRAHNREHGVTDSRDYSPEFLRTRRKQRVDEMNREDKADRIHHIRRALDG